MRKIVLILVLLMYLVNQGQQTTSVENNLFGVQLGILSLDFQNEVKLDRKLALRSEAGVNTFLLISSDETSTIIAPSISIEPRWYYGLDRRARLGKNTKNNSSNFLSLKSSYQTNLEIYNSNDLYKAPQFLTFIPSYGIRRNFATNFNYEFRFGLGIIHYLDEYRSLDKTLPRLDIDFRIGYNF